MRGTGEGRGGRIASEDAGAAADPGPNLKEIAVSALSALLLRHRLPSCPARRQPCLLWLVVANILYTSQATKPGYKGYTSNSVCGLSKMGGDKGERGDFWIADS